MKRTAAALAALLLLGLSATACAEDGDDSGGGDGGAKSNTIKSGLKIAFLPKQVNNPYFDTSDNKGGKVAVEEFKGTYSETGPTQASPSAQVSDINTLSQQGTNVIVVSANDKDAICGALNEARQAGAKVVTFDSDANKSCRDAFINQATTEGIGESLAKMALEQAGAAGGEIAVLSATPNATNQNSWIAVMKTELAKPEYSKLKLVKVAYGNDDDQKSFQEAQGLMQSYPNLKVIVAPTTVGILAAAQVVSGAKKSDSVKVTGLGFPNDMKPFVKDGTSPVFGLWSVPDLGYLAEQVAEKLVSGQIKGTEGETFSVKGLNGDKPYTIGKDSIVVLGPAFRFDKTNVDNGPPVADEYLYAVVDVLDAVAAETGKTIPQIALNWLLQRPTVATIIVGARNEEQLRQNLGAIGWRLTPEQIARLDAASVTPLAYPYWHQRGFTERNPPPV